MSTLLTIYTSASTNYPMRRKAGRDHPGSINQPCLTIFGTAMPNHYYAALSEHIRKFALIYVASANHQAPAIDAEAVRWATRLVMHQTRRMLFMARSHIAENPFHADCLRLLQRLREAPDHAISHSVLLKRMKLDTQSFQKLIQTLVQQGDVVVEPVKSAGRTGNVYRLAPSERR